MQRSLLQQSRFFKKRPIEPVYRVCKVDGSRRGPENGGLKEKVKRKEHKVGDLESLPPSTKQQQREQKSRSSHAHVYAKVYMKAESEKS